MAQIISRIKAGEEPVPEQEAMTPAKGPMVGELVEAYLKEVVEVRLQPRSARTYRSSIDNHILPALGRKPALSIDHAAVSAFHHSLRDTPVAANKAVDVLFRIYRAADERETIPEGSNPCRQIAMNRPRRHEGFLTDEEFQRLGWALDEAKEKGGARMYAAMAVRLPQERDRQLALGPCRPEVRRDAAPRHEDWPPDGADVTGRRRAVGAYPAGRRQPPCHCGRAGCEPMSNLQSRWATIRERAGLEDMRLHDCRHYSFASRALALGRMFDYSEVKTTARYAHLARELVREAGERVAVRVEGLLKRTSRGSTPDSGRLLGGCEVTGQPPGASRGLLEAMMQPLCGPTQAAGNCADH